MPDKNSELPQLPILSFRIDGYKNERDGRQVDNNGADDVYSHNGPAGVSVTIANLLADNNLTAADVINVTATTSYGKVAGRDCGSWEFWVFCRNPAFQK